MQKLKIGHRAKFRARNKYFLQIRTQDLKAMLHEAIFLAICNVTNVALQVARKNSRVTPHFATAIVALRVARKVQRPSTFHNVARQVACVYVTSPRQLATPFCQNGPIRAHLSLAGNFRHLVCYCTRCKLRKKLLTCDTPSAT